MSTTRRHVAIVAADVAGYAAAMEGTAALMRAAAAPGPFETTLPALARSMRLTGGSIVTELRSRCWSALAAFATIASLALCCGYAVAENYPVSGGWAYVDNNLPAGSDRKNCEALRRFGVSKLSGNVVGDFTVFSGSKRYDFGGYIDDEKQNLSVTPTRRRNEFDIAELFYSDGEGGGRAGKRIRRYKMILLTSDRIEIKEGRYTNTLVRCEALLSPPAIPKQPLFVLPKAAPQLAASKERPTASIDLVELISLFVINAGDDASMLNWHDASPEGTPVLWITEGLGDCDPYQAKRFGDAFCRNGRALATIGGRPTHRVLQRTSVPGIWEVNLMGARNGATVALVSSDVNSQELDRDTFPKAVASKQIKLETIKRSCWETNGTDIYRLTLPKKRPTTVGVTYSCGSGGCGVELAIFTAEGPKDKELLANSSELPCTGASMK
jgi:hypothetical protein